MVPGPHAPVQSRDDEHSEAADLARLVPLIALNPNPVLEVDGSGGVTYRNSAAARLLPDLAGDGGAHPFVTGAPELLAAFRAGRAESVVRELRLGGKIYEQHISWIPGSDRLCLHAIDVSERRMLERQVLQSQKLESVGELAAGIAHEINTPLQYVGDNTQFLKDAFGGMCEYLARCRALLATLEERGLVPDEVSALREAADAADLDYCLERIAPAIEQSQVGLRNVAKIVRALREFSHPSLAERKAVDINHAVENTVTISRNEWKYVADLHVDLAPDIPPVTCFGGEVNQVLLNLIVNASHAIADAVRDRRGERGEIRVSTRRDGRWVEIRVADTGTGIPEAIRHKIFDPFFTTKEVGKGTGQGLALAHAIIVGKHQGTLTFETEVGRGTTFIIRLPLGAEESR